MRIPFARSLPGLGVATVASLIVQSTSVWAQSSTSLSGVEAQIQSLQNQIAKLSQERPEQITAPASPSSQTSQVFNQSSEPKLPFGTFKLGGVTVTLGGFAAAEGVYRSRNEAGTVATNFNGIPLPNSPNYHTPEYRESSQQSRLSLLTQANIDKNQHLTGYVETDFMSAGSSSNSNQSNSYTLRLRQFWGEYDNDAWGFHVIGGQGWSLATMYSHGLLPRSENVPLTIDAQYVVGFDWERQTEIRVVKDFDHQKLWLGLSAEEPQTTFGSSAGPSCLSGSSSPTAMGGGELEYDQCGGSNVNPYASYSDTIAPDIIAKVAADPGYGHYELYGLMSFLGGRVSYPAAGDGQNYETVGGGIGGGMILPLIKNKLSFQFSGLVGNGVGRYGTSQLPDATFSPTGKIEPLPAYSLMGGIVAHPTPKLDIYSYAGAEGVWSKSYQDGSVNSGYGNPNTNLAGCDMELGSCSANTSSLVEGTIGAWYRFLKGSYGTLEAGAQYEYIKRNTFAGESGIPGVQTSPSTNENAVLVSFRYLPFN